MYYQTILLEIVNIDQYPGRVSTLLPLIAGHLNYSNITYKWYRLGINTDNLLTHEEELITIPKNKFDLLLEKIVTLHPKYIISTDDIIKSQLNLITQNNCKFYTTLDFISSDEILKHPFIYTKALSNESYNPRYNWEAIDESVSKNICNNNHLFLIKECGHRKSIIKNKVFSHYLGEHYKNWHGCSFCYKAIVSQPEKDEKHTPQIWIEKQISAIAHDTAITGNQLNAILIPNFESKQTMNAICQNVVKHSVLDNCIISLGIRPNKVPAYLTFIRNQKYKKKINFGIHACGIESFVQEELEVLNKGTTVRQTLKALYELLNAKNEFEDQFPIVGLSFILFTPWTKRENLLLNLKLIYKFSIPRIFNTNILQARLRLHEGLPLTELAQKTVNIHKHNNNYLKISKRKLFSSEMMWVPLDRRLVPFENIFFRYERLSDNSNDPILKLIKSRLSHISGKTMDVMKFLEFSIAMLEVINNHEEPLEEEQLIDCTIQYLKQAKSQLLNFKEPFLQDIPDCCKNAKHDTIITLLPSLHWQLFYMRLHAGNIVKQMYNPFTSSETRYLPCNINCQQSMKLAASEDDSNAYLFSLDSFDEVYSFQVEQFDEKSLILNPETLQGPQTEIYKSLHKSQKLNFLPGQIQIISHDNNIYPLTLSHGIWFNQYTWNPNEWIYIIKLFAYSLSYNKNETKYKKLNLLLKTFADRLKQHNYLKIDSFHFDKQKECISIQIMMEGKNISLVLNKNKSHKNQTSEELISKYFDISMNRNSNSLTKSELLMLQKFCSVLENRLKKYVDSF